MEDEYEKLSLIFRNRMSRCCSPFPTFVPQGYAIHGERGIPSIVCVCPKCRYRATLYFGMARVYQRREVYLDEGAAKFNKRDPKPLKVKTFYEPLQWRPAMTTNTWVTLGAVGGGGGTGGWRAVTRI